MQRVIILIIFFGKLTFAQDSLNIKKEGIYYGINIGTWLPDNKNKILGNPSIIGLTFDFKGSKNAYAFNFDLIGLPNGSTKKPLVIKYGDSTLTRNDYFGAQITLDYCRQLFETNHFAFEGMTGIGYGNITYYNPNKNTDINKSSLIVSPGFSIRYVFGVSSFLQIKTQYCIANYNLNDNISTNLSGNYLITKLIFGGFL